MSVFHRCGNVACQFFSLVMTVFICLSPGDILLTNVLWPNSPGILPQFLFDKHLPSPVFAPLPCLVLYCTTVQHTYIIFISIRQPRTTIFYKVGDESIDCLCSLYKCEQCQDYFENFQAILISSLCVFFKDFVIVDFLRCIDSLYWYITINSFFINYVQTFFEIRQLRDWNDISGETSCTLRSLVKDSLHQKKHHFGGKHKQSSFSLVPGESPPPLGTPKTLHFQPRFCVYQFKTISTREQDLNFG